jgi:uncharacterized protein (DUF1800 family)
MIPPRTTPPAQRLRVNAPAAYIALLVLAASLAAGCASVVPAGTGSEASAAPGARNRTLMVINRITWGATPSLMQQVSAAGLERYIDQQLQAPAGAMLPAAVQLQIDALSISQKPLESTVLELEQRRRDADAIADPAQKKAAQQAYQQELTRIAREAATRSLLRALYSPNQLQEQMTWFWMNHFNVHQYKGNIRALIGDYEERAIRPRALGRFRDLLGATVRHPAMLRYLDNEQNAAGHINENYARELMELHTLRVGSGYTQSDVQELARILTGVGINLTPNQPKLRPGLQSQYVREGLFEFNPARHDFGDKLFLRRPVKGRGLAELDEALDRLAREPATARFIATKLAVYFVSDTPSPALVGQLAASFLASDGNIATVLRDIFSSPEFGASLGHKFKDPVHYVVSAVRLAYDNKPILNAGPMINWLNRMGEPLHSHETPDGFAMTQAAWASPGQMTTRFEIGRAIGSGSAGLFKSDGPLPTERAAFPQIANALFFNSMQSALSGTTRQALDQANSPQEWNTFLLSSPEFMNR